ncbi:hypothetical protein B879_03651 [Cecembia lonarensis LW9]|uniref:Uncharacterized protein n=2 Tax=Cecembia TaxID=1187078 RepID=K1LUH3_CECL9|nr:hypothetical protein B879_03651 [Cecembia lonarensis LW9]
MGIFYLLPKKYIHKKLNMKKALFLLFVILSVSFSCVEKEEVNQTIPDDTLFIKVKIDGVDYEYSYKLPDGYHTADVLDMNEYLPGVGGNFIIFSNQTLEFNIQKGCTNSSGKKACVILKITDLNTIGKTSDPFVTGVLPGEPFRHYLRNFSYYNEQPKDFEVTLKNYDPIKFTIEGTFKGKVRLMEVTENPEIRIIDIEGSFRSGAII